MSQPTPQPDASSEPTPDATPASGAEQPVEQAQHGHPAQAPQAPPQQGFPSPAPYPQQQYPAQQYPGQQPAPQAYPNQQYPNQGYPNDGYPNDGYPTQTAYPVAGYGYAAQGYAAPAPANNTMALISMVAGILGWTMLPFIGSVAAVITGHMARKEIARTGQPGSGMALAGLILGYAMVGLAALLIIGWLLLWGVFAAAWSTSTY